MKTLSSLVRCAAVASLLAALPFALAAAQSPAPAGASHASPATGVPPPVKLTNQQAHARMMRLLGIKSLRPGADPNHPGAPNYVNYNEAKANPYPKLPNPLVLNDGKPVTSAAMWWHQRRPQIVTDFNNDIYGWVPKHVPAVHWQVTSTEHGMEGKFPVITRHVVGHLDNSAYPAVTVNIELTVTTPANAKGPVPVMMQFGFDPAMFKKFIAMMKKRGFKMPALPPGPPWQQQVLAKGWGYAIYVPYSVQPDNAAGLTEGVIGLANHGRPRQPGQWGVLRAWAWGASRALDFLETDRRVDARQVGLEGHSRWGKAALVAMAYDHRFAIAYVSSSGKGGAELYRRHFGEMDGNLAAANEYHWFAGNFLKYDGPLHADNLPVDSHELIAMCAPHPVFISGGTVAKGDGWVDARGMFMATAAASPVYKLLGKEGLETSTFPPTGTPLLQGTLGFRQHHWGHTDVPNWPWFIRFASRFLGTPASRAPEKGGE